MLNAIPTPHHGFSIRWLAIPAALLAAGVLAVSANAASGSDPLRFSAAAVTCLRSGQVLRGTCQHVAKPAPIKKVALPQLPIRQAGPRIDPNPNLPAFRQQPASAQTPAQKARWAEIRRLLSQ